MFENIDIDLSKLVPSDDDWEVIKQAVDKGVKEWCENNGVDFNSIDYEYNTQVSINIFSLVGE